MVSFIDSDERRFMEHVLVNELGTTDLDEYRRLQPEWAIKENLEAKAIFSAISGIFSYPFRKDTLPVCPHLLEYLAACARVSLAYGKNQPIPWDTSAHDNILQGMLRWFMQTIYLAIRERHTVEKREGVTYYGGFPIPQWLVEKAEADAAQRAAYREECREKYGPGHHLFLLHSDTYE
jgi:hypothetical protein